MVALEDHKSLKKNISFSFSDIGIGKFERCAEPHLQSVACRERAGKVRCREAEDLND